MTKLKLNDRVLVRTPRFSYTDRLTDSWEELKLLIRDASPDLYAVVKDLSHASFLKAEPKVQLAVNKYFNRARFRSTPYGAFAAISLTRLSTATDEALQLSEQPFVHRFADWRTAPPDISVQFNDPSMLFFTNTSYYRVMDEIRFIQRQDDNYIMAAIDFDPIILYILDICHKPTSFPTLLAALNEKLSATDLEGYLTDLHEVQLLLTNKSRNIIGEDYFNRVVQADDYSKEYLVAERKTQEGSINRQVLRHLPELALKLQSLAPAKSTPNMVSFRNQFIRKYEGSEVGIMEALDPDVGIGYGNMTLNEDQMALSPYLFDDTPDNAATQYNQLRTRLMQAMIAGTKGNPIALETLLPKERSEGMLPNTLSAGVTVVDDQVFLEHMGGATATSILGRFALALPKVEEYCKELTDWEEAANPDVLLFDIGYTKEDAVDNVNRRPAIYNHQLNILNYDTSVAPLTIADITLSVQGNEIILRSRSLNKRILPRLATAYNYIRSDLPLFRLLMDIQSQGLSTPLSFRPINLIPDLAYYPRLQFKNIVIAPACWQIGSALFATASTAAEKLAALTHHLHTAIPCRYIKTGIADQTLLFDTEQADDVALLLSLLQKEPSRKIYVEEAALPVTPIIKDENNRAYLPQLILTLQHGDPIAAPLTALQQEFPATAQRQWVAPGGNWLYFEIYSSEQLATLLLVEKIQPYLEQFQFAVRKWFFIRYNEGGTHLRLRLQLNEVSHTGVMVTALTAVLSPELQSGVVSDIKLCTYKKEVHRYLPEQMDRVEHHFYVDSEYVISLLPSGLSANARYQLCVELFDFAASRGLIEPRNIEQLVNKLKDSYNAEHSVKPAQFKAINIQYKEFLQEAVPPLSISSAALFEKLKRSLVDTLAAYPKLIRPKILADLMHMHINRLFSTRQRVHEMLFYNLLTLNHKRQQAQAKPISNLRIPG